MLPVLWPHVIAGRRLRSRRSVKRAVTVAGTQTLSISIVAVGGGGLRAFVIVQIAD
jgi:hypothetical protein